MKEPIWIEINVALALHDLLISKHGGLNGMRELGLLESALMRPRYMLTYVTSDLITLATAYIAGIIHNHPFIDGNKRTGFMVGYTFLARNNIQLVATESEVIQFVLALTNGEMTEQAFAEWLRINVKYNNTLN